MSRPHTFDHHRRVINSSLSEAFLMPFPRATANMVSSKADRQDGRRRPCRHARRYRTQRDSKHHDRHDAGIMSL